MEGYGSWKCSKASKFHGLIFHGNIFHAYTMGLGIHETLISWAMVEP